jgi:GTP-binding protein Era
VGKSTLMNQLVGEKVSIMTSKAQTTRHRIKGIVNGDDYQIVYSDPPGVLDPAYMMQKYMMKFVTDSLQDADIILYLIECGETRYNEQLVEKINKMGIPVVFLDPRSRGAESYKAFSWEFMAKNPTRFSAPAAVPAAAPAAGPETEEGAPDDGQRDRSELPQPDDARADA